MKILRYIILAVLPAIAAEAFADVSLDSCRRMALGNNKLIRMAEENLQAKSLRSFVERNQGLHGMRLSMSPYREQDWMTNYPLYAVEAVLAV